MAELISTKKLDFDRTNPRLVEYSDVYSLSEKSLIELLAKVMAVEELIYSIVKSGFFQNDPLVVCKNGDRFTVLEGNRRLAAVKIISNHSAFRKFYPEDLPTPTKSLIDSLENLPCIIEKNKKSAWKFIAFKHVNGPVKWNSYAKAEYIYQIHKDYNVALGEIASTIGDTHNTVLRLYLALCVLKYAEANKLFNKSDIQSSRLYFSHLYTGLSYEAISQYIGLSTTSSTEKLNLKKINKEHLSNLLEWLYGSKRKGYEPVIRTQNPDLRYLNEVLKDRKAVATLVRERDLTSAYEHSRPDSIKFFESITAALDNLYIAQKYSATGYNRKDTSLNELLDNIYLLINSLRDKR